MTGDQSQWVELYRRDFQELRRDFIEDAKLLRDDIAHLRTTTELLSSDMKRMEGRFGKIETDLTGLKDNLKAAVNDQKLKENGLKMLILGAGAAGFAGIKTIWDAAKHLLDPK